MTTVALHLPLALTCHDVMAPDFGNGVLLRHWPGTVSQSVRRASYRIVGWVVEVARRVARAAVCMRVRACVALLAGLICQ